MSLDVKEQPPIWACCFSFLLAGCIQASDSETSSNPIATQQHEGEDIRRRSEINFPAPSDLAVLLDTQMDPVIKAGDRIGYGGTLLSRNWLERVSTAFQRTDIEDALEAENHYEEWRLVSARFTPCSPLGIRPDQYIDDYCWPAVRLVWQPVVEDYRLAWGPIVDFFADDRAIHAIYPVHPRDPSGGRVDRSLLDVVTEILQAGEFPNESTSQVFFEQRDITSTWLLNKVYSLRDPSLSDDSWNTLGLRPETQMDDETLYAFQARLKLFLEDFAQPQDLREMTAFSLPEGRNPSGSDLWVFLQFLAENGQIYQNELNVIGRESGEVLATIGMDQSVGVGLEDPAVERALEFGNQELEDSLIVSGDDIASKGSAMADPYQFLVPNTSCASCHRLNDLRFDFHSLSGFEDRGITVSPRVDKDVARDIYWTRSRGL